MIQIYTAIYKIYSQLIQETSLSSILYLQATYCEIYILNLLVIQTKQI